MLDGFGLHSLIWNLADQVVSDILVASPMDAQGRGIALEVRDAGVAADLDGATAYLVWTHRGTGKRGTSEFEAVDASAGKFQVFYPAAMCGAGGIVDVSVMLSLGDGRYLSTRDFNIRVERVLIDGLEPEDGFTLFLQAIAAYENAGDISTEAATAANGAADAANAAAGNAAQAVADMQAAAAAGDFAGSDGADGADGFSPVATVTQNATGGATITITDKNGTTSADISKGAQVEKGDKGDTGEMAAAILALTWDVGLKPRAVLTSLGTLEFNYVDGRHCYSGGVPVNAWEASTTGYSSASARAYDEEKLQVRKVVIHSSFAEVGLNGAVATHDMRSVFVGSGLFEWLGMSFLAEPGDLYLSEANHVAMWQTQYPGVLSEFSWGDNGAHGNKRGDQSGHEASVRSYYGYRLALLFGRLMPSPPARLRGHPPPPS